jgi:hypothetical protein
LGISKATADDAEDLYSKMFSMEGAKVMVTRKFTLEGQNVPEH